MRCASTETMDQYMPLVGIPNILPADAANADAAKSEEKELIYYFATLNVTQVCFVCFYIYIYVCLCVMMHAKSEEEALCSMHMHVSLASCTHK